MTRETAAPARTDIAQDLIGRVEAARRTRRAPAHVRKAATADDVQAARYAALADAQALRRLVTKYGWTGRSLVGGEGSEAALAIALQADHDSAFQKPLLTMLAAAVHCGDATTAQWAHLHARYLAHSRPQEYGTQYWLLDGRIELHPVADPGGLDKRRSDVGLPPQREQVVLLERHHLASPALAPPRTPSSPTAPMNTAVAHRPRTGIHMTTTAPAPHAVSDGLSRPRSTPDGRPPLVTAAPKPGNAAATLQAPAFGEPEAIMRAVQLRPLGPFPGRDVPWPSECLVCGRVRRPRLTDVVGNRPGSRCAHNARGVLLPEAIAVADMRLYVGEPLEPYPGVSYQWRTRCHWCHQVVYPRLLHARRRPNPKLPCRWHGRGAYVENSRQAPVRARGHWPASRPLSTRHHGPVARSEVHMAATLRAPAPPAVLTPTEWCVVEKVAAGLSNQEAAAKLSMKTATLSGHLKRIGDKFGVTSRPARVHAVLASGQVPAPKPPGPAPRFTEGELLLLRAVATQSSALEIAEAARLTDTAQLNARIRRLAYKAGARNASHLVGLAHAWRLLDTCAAGQPGASPAIDHSTDDRTGHRHGSGSTSRSALVVRHA